MINKSFKVGRATVTAVDELTAGYFSFSDLMIQFDQELFEERRDLLPMGYSRNENELIPKIQNWLVRIDDRNVLIDSGFGNGKKLPGMPHRSNLNTPFLDNLRAEGLEPEDIDTVLLTHLHTDHVGWNTYWDGYCWVPTFSRANYICTDVEKQYWDSTSIHYSPTGKVAAIMENSFEESMLPIIQEGLLETMKTDGPIDELFTYIPSPGHSPGQACIKFECDGEAVLFCGDSFHHPIQILIPQWCMVFDENIVESVKSRQRILELCVQENLILAPAHFTHQACRVLRHTEGYVASNIEMTASGKPRS